MNDSLPAVSKRLCLLAFSLVLLVGCCSSGCSKRPEPTPAPPLPTSLEMATNDQMRLLVSGYADVYAGVAHDVTVGKIKTNEAMREALVNRTREARLAAELPVLDEFDANFPQAEDGTWPDPEAVAKYLRAVSAAYRKLH